LLKVHAKLLSSEKAIFVTSVGILWSDDMEFHLFPRELFRNTN